MNLTTDGKGLKDWAPIEYFKERAEAGGRMGLFIVTGGRRWWWFNECHDRYLWGSTDWPYSDMSRSEALSVSVSTVKTATAGRHLPNTRKLDLPDSTPCVWVELK